MLRVYCCEPETGKSMVGGPHLFAIVPQHLTTTQIQFVPSGVFTEFTRWHYSQREMWICITSDLRTSRQCTFKVPVMNCVTRSVRDFGANRCHGSTTWNTSGSLERSGLATSMHGPRPMRSGTTSPICR